MINQLFINEVDAFAAWGISMDTQALSALMTPAPQKQVISVNSRLQHGARVINNTPRVDARDITLTLYMHADTEQKFMQNYGSFCDNVLAKGAFTVRTCYQPETLYKLQYVSCTQFTQYLRSMAKLSLRCTEPNPKDRSMVNATAEEDEV